MPAVHSGAIAQYDGKWLLIGGRENGLHGFQPAFAFPSNGINDRIYVVDPYADQVWSASAVPLPIDIVEPITSSNIPHYQDDTLLYLAGGYGWKGSANDYVTFPTLTRVSVPRLIDSVVGGNSFGSLFTQIVDSTMQITGGQLRKIDSVYYLVFGHDFEGRYDEEDTTGFFTQDYSYSIRKFTITDTNGVPALTHIGMEFDSTEFRRRDLNVIEQIFPDGSHGLTAFAGVFQEAVNLPFLTPIDINSTTYIIQDTFKQRMSQYENAHVAIYDSLNNYMHTIFFGGMSQFFIDTISGAVVEDSAVPFVRTISRITRAPDSSLTEYVYPFQLPDYLGSNAFFVRDTSAKFFGDGIIDLNVLAGKQRIGFIIGGIQSPDSNISKTDPALSQASARVFEVLVDVTTVAEEWKAITDLVGLIVFPNPVGNELNVLLDSPRSIKGNWRIFNIEGREVFKKGGEYAPGENTVQLDVSGLPSGDYTLSFQYGDQAISRRFSKIR